MNSLKRFTQSQQQKTVSTGDVGGHLALPYLQAKRRLSTSFKLNSFGESATTTSTSELLLQQYQQRRRSSILSGLRTTQPKLSVVAPASLHKHGRQQLCRWKLCVRVVIVCLRWSHWAQRNYRIKIHRYMSFAHINDTFKFRDEFHFEFLKLLSNQKRLAQTQSATIQEDELNYDELVENGRTRAEMMNFDVNYYKASKRLVTMITSERVKEILSAANVKRRERKDVVLVERALKQIEHLRLVNELPALLRARFIESCWLDEYESQRVLVAQHRAPQFFYVIVKGTLVCTYRDETDVKSQTVCQLEQGRCFGDISLLDETINTVTVSTSSDTQLLVIDKQDFISIFLAPPIVPTTSTTDSNISSTAARLLALNNNNENDDIFKWLKSTILFMRDWPFDSLADEEKSQIRLHRVPRGRLLTNNSRASEFIYIIKTGSVTVWIPPNNNNNNDLSKPQESQQITRIDEEEPMSQTKPPDIIPPKEETSKNGATQNQNNKSSRLSYFPENALLEGHHVEVLKKLGIERKSHPIIYFDPDPVVMESLPTAASTSRKSFPARRLKLPKIVASNSPRKTSSFKNNNNNKTKNTSSGREMKLQQIIKKADYEKEITPTTTSTRGMFKLRTMYAGDYCGLNDVLFDNQPAMELVSYGCECVLVPKTLFVKHTTSERMRELRALERAYPQFARVENTLKSHAEWKRFKRNVLLVAASSSVSRSFKSTRR